jgi:NADPH:quinone reductase-like Zn-dependent oxidoreductase
MTAALSLYQVLRFSLPWLPATKPTPLVVYGASSGVGAYVIKLPTLSNIHPIIAVAGKGKLLVETLIDRSKGDTILDYRESDDALVSRIHRALGGRKIEHAYDAISEKSSFVNVGKVIEPETGLLTVVLPGRVCTRACPHPSP